MPYRQSPHPIKSKHTIDYYNPNGNPQTIMPSTYLPNTVPDNDGTIAEFQHVVSTASFCYKQISYIFKQHGLAY